MNTDYLVQNQQIRDQRLQDKLTCRGEKNFNCGKVNRYAANQNTIYDPMQNLMLYGINANMGVLGVSDGTCNQINPLIFTQPYMCGFGAAGGNPCVKDAYGIENFESGTQSCKDLNSIIIILVVVVLVMALYKNYYKNK